MLKANLIKQFNYCNAIANDIIEHNKSKEIQEYAKQFAEIESPLVGGTDADWIRINWGDIYIFLCDNGSTGYQVDPLGGTYGSELIDTWGCTKEDFIKEILSLEAAPIIRNGITFFESEESVSEPPMYMPMKQTTSGGNMGKKYYSIEDAVNNVSKKFKLGLKDANDMDEEEFNNAEEYVLKYVKFVKHPDYEQLVPQSLETGEFIL